MSKSSRLVVFLAVVLLLAACSSATPGGSGTASSTAESTAPSAATSAGTPVVAGPGNAANGDKLFHSTTLGKDNVPGCTTCHSTEKEKNGTGPSLSGIAPDAAGAFKEDDYKGQAKDAASWLKEQIVNPNLDLVEGFQPNIMPKNYGTELTDSELNDLAAYLLTLQ